MTDDGPPGAGTENGATVPAKDPRAAGGAGPDAPESLAEALSLRRNALVGLAVGLGLAALLYLPELPALRDSFARSTGYYLGLALVLAATTAATVSAGLCAKAMLAPVLDRRAWLRRGGTAGLVGGTLWAGLPVLAWLANTGWIDGRLWRVTTGLAALSLVVGTAGLHAAVRGGTAESSVQPRGPRRDGSRGSGLNGSPGRGSGARGRIAARIERVAYWVVVLSLLLAAGNASGNAGAVLPDSVVTGTLPTPFFVATFLALAVAVPWAASAELAGQFAASALRAVHLGALAGTLGVAWLFAGGGWAWLEAVATPPTATALALGVATVPSGAGWAFAGASLGTAATGASPGDDPTS